MANGNVDPQSQNSEIVNVEGGNQQNIVGAGATTESSSIENNREKVKQKLKVKKFLEEKIEKKEEQILKLEANVFQLANYYFVFQGVILTAIIKGTSGGLKCHQFWLPFFMSLVGALLNLGTLLIIALKYKESLDELDEYTIELYKHLSDSEGKDDKLTEEHKRKKTYREVIMVLSLILFLVFAGLNLYAARKIPCTGVTVDK